MCNASQIDRHIHHSLCNLSVGEYFRLVEPSNSEARCGLICPMIRNKIMFQLMAHNPPVQISVSEVQNFSVPSYQIPLKSDFWD